MNRPTTLLKIPDFFRLLTTRMCVSMALQAQAVIVGWQVYEITESAWMLGLIGLAEAVPALACSLFSGHVVDSNRPQRVFMTCITVLCINTLILLLVAGGWIWPVGDHTLPWLFVGIFISGAARSFFMPSGFSLLGCIIPRNIMPKATATITTSFQIASVTGPAMAGLVYAAWGAGFAWMISCTLVAFALFNASRFSDGVKAHRNQQHREPAWQSITAGWKMMFQKPILLQIMLIDMFAVLFGGAVAILPAFADQVLHTGAEGLGILRAAPAVGAAVCGLYFALRPLKAVRARWLIYIAAAFGFCIIGFGLSTSFGYALLFLALSGVADCISVIIRQNLMQLLTPDAMRGRISAVNTMFIISSNEIGAFYSGGMAALLGLVPSIVWGGVGSILVALGGAMAAKSLRGVVVHPHEKQSEG